MQSADRAILATLAYYGAFSWPLTPLEVRAKLIAPARLGGSDEAPTLAAVMRRLEVLSGSGRIAGRLGLFGPSDLPVSAFDDRVRREKETARKWRVLRRVAVPLQAAPFVRALFASGSLALGNASPTSDWDLLVIARSGRLYTARACLLALAWLTGRLRTKRHSVAPDRFCFNHWLTDGALELRHRSLFTASVLAALVPLADGEGLLGRLRESNAWADAYTGQPADAPTVRREVGESRLLRGVRRIAEGMLGGRAGDRLEEALCRWQQKRIVADPATHAPGGRVVADATEIEFHPRSFEALALTRYNAALSGLGLGAHAEEDSGLTK